MIHDSLFRLYSVIRPTDQWALPLQREPWSPEAETQTAWGCPEHWDSLAVVSEGRKEGGSEQTHGSLTIESQQIPEQDCLPQGA